MNKKPHSFFSRGEPWVWVTGVAMSLMVFMMVVLLAVVTVNGAQAFWPKNIYSVSLKNGSKFLGEILDRTETIDGVTGEEVAQIQMKIGNRDLYGLDFTWINQNDILSIKLDKDAYMVERSEYGNFYGYLVKMDQNLLGASNFPLDTSRTPQLQLRAAYNDSLRFAEQFKNAKSKVRSSNEYVRRQGLIVKKDPLPKNVSKLKALKSKFDALVEEMRSLEGVLQSTSALLRSSDGQTVSIALGDIVRFEQNSAMNVFEKFLYYGKRVVELFVDDPRESNTEGGLFPAIFGTVLLILIMSLSSFPLGLLAGIYLKEYAKDGPFVRLVRIGVNNLAGIPSIVYGIFGLGFFVYGIGSSLDQFFFSDRLPEPTFGTGGILWASLTLGVLTIPVVIVATEEALRSIPGAVRESAFALGATKLQTLVKVLLPMASPGIMTGFILAMARAAGEVAPLMITGVVKLAPSLPIDGFFPFLHLDRKFMHLGFHIYDISAQSPNVEAAKPMVYVTTGLLILIVLAMSGLAIFLRNRMRKRYHMSSI